MSMNWETILGWLIKGISGFMRQPKLKILGGADVKNWSFLNTGETRRFATLEVKNRGNQTAKRCEAVAELVEQPKNVTHLDREYALHWADVPYSARSTGAEPV